MASADYGVHGILISGEYDEEQKLAIDMTYRETHDPQSQRLLLLPNLLAKAMAI
jgi:hypothetical protein